MIQTDITRLQIRARIYQQIRAFFARLDYLEVDTPLLQASTNTDPHIQSITATANRQQLYLQTSPEFAMKRLLAQGSGSIFQICHAFRDEEQGRRHAPEFTLLEWYSLGFDYRQLMDQMEQLINAIFGEAQEFHRVSYFDAFQQKLDLDLTSASDDDCRACVRRFVPSINSEPLQREDCLDLLISQVIAPQFKGFTFVYDYPSSQASLSKISAQNPQLCERFELFYGDMELANGFSELTDADEQRQRFEQDNQQRVSKSLPSYPIDKKFLNALDQGLPECAGVALGLERLIMVMMGCQSIEKIQALES